MTAPALIFGYGNPGRGDDSLGPECVEQLRVVAGSELDLLTDFQLQPEHALDLRGRRRVLFIDAAAQGDSPYSLKRLRAAPDASAFTHAMSPQALLAVYERIEGARAPDSWLLAIRGYSFEPAEPLGDRARANLRAAVDWARSWIAAVPPIWSR